MPKIVGRDVTCRAKSAPHDLREVARGEVARVERLPHSVREHERALAEQVRPAPPQRIPQAGREFDHASPARLRRPDSPEVVDAALDPRRTGVKVDVCPAKRHCFADPAAGVGEVQNEGIGVWEVRPCLCEQCVQVIAREHTLPR
jgi:hypothetical protein